MTSNELKKAIDLFQSMAADIMNKHEPVSHNVDVPLYYLTK